MRRFLFPLFLFALPVLAQEETPPQSAGDTSPTGVVLGLILKGLLALVLVAGAWAVMKTGELISAKAALATNSTSRSVAWGLVNNIWVKVQSAGSKVLAREKPLLEKVLADGKVTAEEFDMLKTQTVLILREVAAAEIAQLGPVLGIFGDNAVGHFLDGFAAKVVTGLVTNQDAIAPTPAAPTSPV